MDGNSNLLRRFGVLNTLIEVEERRRGLEKLQAAYKALSNEFWTEDGTDYFGQWGSKVEMSLRRTDSLAVEVTAAESSAERLAVEEREVSNQCRDARTTDAISSLEFVGEESTQYSLSFPNEWKYAAPCYFKVSQCR